MAVGGQRQRRSRQEPMRGDGWRPRRRTWRVAYGSMTRFATGLEEYAVMWLRDHPRLGPRWRETCERNLRLHLTPLAALSLRHLTPAVVRSWHADALQGPGGRTSIAQSYRFLLS